MSTSTKATAPKPRRPLSGYNLFYRYKRIKVLEATTRPDGRDRDDKAVIREVLAAVPGLEGVSPRSPIFASSPARLNEFRATAVRAAMEGQLLPNENARRRVHKRVLGMGFVEMGRVMRQAWGHADKFTKEVFMELAEVGRARYKRLVAEYRLSNERPENVKPSSISLKKWREAQAASFTATSSPVPQQAPSSPDVKIESGTVNEVEKSVAPSVPHGTQSSSDPLLEASSTGGTRNEPAAASLESGNGPSRGRRTSVVAGINRCDVSLFEPLPVGQVTSRVAIPDSKPSTAQTAGDATRPEAGCSHWRRVSPSPAAFATGDGGAGSDPADTGSEGSKTNLKIEKIFLRRAIKKLRDKIVRNNSLLPTDMRVFPKESSERKPVSKSRPRGGSSAPTGNGAARNDAPEKARLEVATSGGPREGEASEGDFMEFVDGLAEFIDKMDEAIDSQTLPRREITPP